MDEAGTLDGEPEISTVGLYEPREEDEDFPELETAIRDALHRLGRRDRTDAAAVEEATGQAVRRTVNRLLGKKPMNMVPVIRLGIGRASCWERVGPSGYTAVVAVTIKKK